MLRISKMADYATLIMVQMAREKDKVSSVKDIASQIHVPEPSVSKLLKLLSKSGLVLSQRGSKGGYSLALAANEISVLDIIQVVEGRTGITECSFIDGECALQPVCLTTANWQVINKAIATALDSVTLADLARPRMRVAQIDVSDITHLRKPAE